MLVCKGLVTEIISYSIRCVCAMCANYALLNVE